MRMSETSLPIPFNNFILVELLSKYKHTQTTDNRTVETKSRGLCIDLPDGIINAQMLKGKVVYFNEFEDTTNYLIDGKTYAFIEVTKITGYEK